MREISTGRLHGLCRVAHTYARTAGLLLHTSHNMFVILRKVKVAVPRSLRNFCSMGLSPGMDHLVRPHEPIELGRAHVARPQRLLAQGRSIGVGALGDRRGA